MIALRFFAVACVCVSCLALVGCSDAPSKVEVVAESSVEAAPESVAKSTGVLHYDGLPPGSVTVAEVLIVEKLSDAGRARLERQRELFEYKITGRVEQAAETSVLAGVSAADATNLVERFNQLSAEFPPVLVQDVDVGNHRLKKYQSDRERHKAYQYLFGALQWDNFERGLKFIAEKFEEDERALVAQANSLEMEDDHYAQVRVTLDWLKSVQVYYNAYVQLATDTFEARNRYLQAQATAQSVAEPTDWNTYAAVYGSMLIIDTSEYLEGAAMVADDGSFEVEGHGLLIVRLELEGVSVYFLPTSENEVRVRVEDLTQL